MKINIKQETVYTLSITEEEAKILLEMCLLTGGFPTTTGRTFTNELKRHLMDKLEPANIKNLTYFDINHSLTAI